MSDTAKAIGGFILFAGGVVLQVVPVPGVAQFAGLILMRAGSMLLQQGLFGTPQIGEGSQVSSSGSQHPLSVVYGEYRLSHSLVDVRSTGTDNSWLWMVGSICLAGESGKDIESIEAISIYKDEDTVVGLTTNRGTTGQTQGILVKYLKDPDQHYKYQISLGKDTQTVDPWLEAGFPDEWGATSGIDHQEGRGIVYAVHAFFVDKDEQDNLWARGQPDRDITYFVRGALLYDPRYPTDGPDSDGWIWDRADSPGLVWNPPTSVDNHPGSNPALQILDYLTSQRYGLGVFYPERDGGDTNVSEIDEQSFIDLAEHCDEPVTTTGLPENETNPRYTSNGLVSTGDGHKGNLERLLSSCNTMLVYESGKYKVIPRKVMTPVTYEITEPEIVGEIVWVREGISVPNEIIVRYVDRERNWKIQDYVWPKPTNDYLVADNGVVVQRTVDLPMTTYDIQAQQLAMLLLRETREDVTIEIVCRESAIQLSIGDVVNVSHETVGWTQKPFWVVGMALNSDDTVTLQLNEYADVVYSLDPNEDTPTTPGTDLPDPFTVVAPTGVSSNCSAGYYLNDGVFVPRVEVTWTHSTDGFAKYEELVYKKDTDTEWIFTGITVRMEDTEVASWESDLEIGIDYDFGVVAWNTINYRSAVAEAPTPCTIAPPSDNPDDVTILTSAYTCLEGITITWDNPIAYTEANDIGVREIGFYSVEVREQGAGGTEIDRWNAGTFIESVWGTSWNLPYDEVTKGTYDLTLRRFDRFGNPATTPTELQLVNTAYPCSGFGANDPSEYGKIIHNPGFESGGRWWYGPTGAAISGTSPIAESNSLTITAGGAERWVRAVTDVQDDITLGVGEEDYISVEEGDYMFLAAYGATTGATATVRAKTYDKDGAFQANIDFFTFTSSTAERKKNYILIPSGIEFVVVEIAIASGTGVGKFDNFAGYLFPPRLPTVKEIITYPTAAQGKLEIEINITQSVLISVEMKKYEDQTWDAGWTDVTPSPYDMTVTLSEKHGSAITYRVGYDLTGTGEGTTEYIENSVSFDLDTLPELGTPSFDVDPDTGNVILHWSGDDDVAYIKYETKASPTDWASDAAARTAAQGGTQLNDRSGSATLSGAGLPIPESDFVYVAILAYTSGDTESVEVYRATLTRGAGSVIVPTIQSQLDYSGSNGTITLVINDPQTRVTLVQWRAKTGPPGTPWPGSWTTDTGPPPTYNDAIVVLDEKYDSNIAWQVSYTDPDGTSILEGNVTFDADRFPEMGSFGLTIDDAGAATLNYHGDDDVGSIKWSWRTDRYPTESEVRTESCPGRCNDARSEGALNVGAGTIAEGDTLFVSFFAYTGVDPSLGTESAILYECQATYQTDDTGSASSGVSIQNGDFELWHAHWTARKWNGSTLSLVTTGVTLNDSDGTFSPLEGAWDSRLEARTDGTQLRLYQAVKGVKSPYALSEADDPLKNFPVEPENVVKIVATAYKDQAIVSTSYIKVDWLDSSEVLLSTSTAITVNAITNEQYTGRVTAPANTVFCRIFVEQSNDTVGGMYSFWDAITASIDQVAGAVIDDISDVNAPSPGDTQVLTWVNGSSEWQAVDASAGVTDLVSLTDTIITGPSNDDVLQWDGTADWVDRSLAEAGISATGHTHTLDADLTDTLITGPTDLDLLQWNGTDWVDRSLAECGITSGAATLDELTDTDITGPTPNDLLQWNGTDWLDRSLTEAGVAAESHTHTYADTNVRVEKDSSLVSQIRNTLNFIQGDNTTLTVTDDVTNDEVDIRIDAFGTVAKLDDVGDVNVVETAGDLLYYTGGQWTGQSFSELDLWSGALDLEENGTLKGSERRINFTDGSGVDVTVTDAGTEMTVAITGASHTHAYGDTNIRIERNGTLISQVRNTLNFIQGANITLTVEDDSGSDEVDITIAGSAGSTTLDGLTDTNITGPSNNDVLQWNNSDWVDRSLSEAGISGTGHNHTGVYALVSHDHTLAALTDTVISGVGNGEVLMWASGSDWVNRTLAEANIATAGHSHAGSLSTGGENDADYQIGIDANGGGTNYFRVRSGTYTGGTELLRLDEAGSIGFRGPTLQIGNVSITSSDSNTIRITSDGTNADFYAVGGQNLRLRTVNTADRFYLYNGTWTKDICNFWGSSSGTGGPGAVDALYGSIYVNYV